MTKTIEELNEELQAANERCAYLSERKRSNVGNCPSDLQEYDEAWRKRNGLHQQLLQAIEAKRALCKHRWEETHFGKQYWAPGTWQFTCHRCNKTGMVQLGVGK